MTLMYLDPHQARHHTVRGHQLRRSIKFAAAEDARWASNDHREEFELVADAVGDGRRREKTWTSSFGAVYGLKMPGRLGASQKPRGAKSDGVHNGGLWDCARGGR
jgi:hypothetical protein